MTQVALPNHEDIPPKLSQCPVMAAVALCVPENLRAPELLSYSRPHRVGATVVVPETAVHEDDCTPRTEDKVGLSWKVAPMEPKTQAGGVQ